MNGFRSNGTVIFSRSRRAPFSLPGRSPTFTLTMGIELGDESALSYASEGSIAWHRRKIPSVVALSGERSQTFSRNVPPTNNEKMIRFRKLPANGFKRKRTEDHLAIRARNHICCWSVPIRGIALYKPVYSLNALRSFETNQCKSNIHSFLEMWSPYSNRLTPNRIHFIVFDSHKAPRPECSSINNDGWRLGLIPKRLQERLFNRLNGSSDKSYSKCFKSTFQPLDIRRSIDGPCGVRDSILCSRWELGRI